MTPSERKNLTTLRRWYKAYNDPKLVGAAKLKVLLAPLDEGAVLIEHAAPSKFEWGGVHRGHEGWTRFFTILAGALDHADYSLEGIVASGPWVFAWGTLDTKCRKCNKPSRLPWQHRIRMKAGKVIELHEFYDSLQGAIDLDRL